MEGDQTSSQIILTSSAWTYPALKKIRERPWLTQFNGHDTHHVGHGSPPHAAWPWRASSAGAPLLEGARGEGGLRRVGGRPVGLVMGWRGSIMENDEDGWLTWTKEETGGLMMLINFNGVYHDYFS